MKLSNDTYFSNEADREYFSVSQFKSFRECEARTMAKLNGIWKDEDKNAFILGSYVHAWNEGTLEEFKEKHPQIYSSKGATKGQLKADFKIAEKMIATLENDPLVSKVREGEKEQVFTAELFGAKWKIMIDILNHDKQTFTDLKTTKKIDEEYWDSSFREKVNFIKKYDYYLQMAVYAEVLNQNLGLKEYYQPHILAVDKQSQPDKAIFAIGTKFIKEKLKEVEYTLPLYIDIKNGKIEPTRCEKCEYCRSTKKLSKIIYI